MASEQDDTVFPEEDQDLDEDEESEDDDDLENDDVLGENDDEEDEEEELNSPSPSTSSPTPVTTATAAAAAVTVTTAAVTVAVPAAIAASIAAPGGDPPLMATVDELCPDPKRQRISEALVVQEEKKPLPQFDESRRLFQRLWTDEDEIELLQGFLDYTSQRGNAHHHDTALFYDQIKSKLQLDFNKNQLVEKLRRLKKKYRNVLNKISSGKEFSFKSPHDQATFEISRKIWSNTGRVGVEDNVLDDEESHPNPNFEVKSEDPVGNSAEKKTPKSRKRSRSKPAAKVDEKRVSNDGFVTNYDNITIGNNNGSTSNISGLIEETVRSCLSPLFKELLSNAMGGPCGARGFGGLALNLMPLSFGSGQMNFGGGEMVDEKWRKQQILELEVYSKRLELVQDQIKVALEELRSSGG